MKPTRAHLVTSRTDSWTLLQSLAFEFGRNGMTFVDFVFSHISEAYLVSDTATHLPRASIRA
jgi:hypothetical protein